MKVLVACEYSGTVRDAFRERGHEAYSCDLLPNPSPYHIQTDALKILDRGWDLMVCHPPCTHLAVSGARWFGDKEEQQLKALKFAYALFHCQIPKICLENPVSILSRMLGKPDQIIQPWQFGDSFQKTTCLWLKWLKPLQPTQVVDRGEFVYHGNSRLPKWYSNREMNRSKTFAGIAKAMAEQWG